MDFSFFRRHWAELCLFVILIFAFALRMYRLTYQCLNVDEVTTQWIANSSVPFIIHYSLGQDYNPPLFYLIAHYSGLLCGGMTGFALRFPPVVFGTLAIIPIYLIGKEVKNETVGLLVAGLVTFMFPFFVYSQDARAYSLVLLCFSCFVVFWLRCWNGDTRWQNWCGMGIFTALCFYSHFYSLVPIMLLGLALLERQRGAVLKALVLVVLLCIPEGLAFDPVQFHTRTIPQIFNVFWATPIQMATMLLNELFCWSWIVLLPMIGYSLYRNRKNDVLCIFAIVCAISALLLIPLAHFTGLSPRYALLTVPLALCIACYPVAGWIDTQALFERKAAIFLCFLFVVFLFNYGSILSWDTWNYCFAMTIPVSAGG